MDDWRMGSMSRVLVGPDGPPCLGQHAVPPRAGLVRAGLGRHDVLRKRPRPGTRYGSCRPRPHDSCAMPCLDQANISCFWASHGPRAIRPSIPVAMVLMEHGAEGVGDTVAGG